MDAGSGAGRATGDSGNSKPLSPLATTAGSTPWSQPREVPQISPGTRPGPEGPGPTPPESLSPDRPLPDAPSERPALTYLRTYVPTYLTLPTYLPTYVCTYVQRLLRTYVEEATAYSLRTYVRTPPPPPSSSVLLRPPDPRPETCSSSSVLQTPDPRPKTSSSSSSCPPDKAQAPDPKP